MIVDQRKRSCGTYLAFAVCPKVSKHADNVVQARVCALVDEESTQSADGVDDEACFD